MIRFAEWMALESFMDEVKRDVFLESVVSESLEAVFGYLQRGLRSGVLLEVDEEQEDDDGPVELDDPFTGSEDAEPVRGSEDSDSDDTEDDQEEGEDEDGDNENKDLRDILDSLVAIRNEAKRERAEKVKMIIALKKELDKSDPDDLDSKSPLDALPALVELGYIGKERGDKIRSHMIHPSKPSDRSAAERELNQKISDAAAETGNNHEPSRMSAREAMERLSNAMMRVFAGKFGSVARRNQRMISADQVGHVDYEPEELASETMIYLLQRFKKRQWRDGKLMPWEENDEILRSGDLEHIRNYIFSSIKSMGSKLRVKKNASMNPKSKSRMKGLEASVGAKATVIRKDLKDDNMEFYLRYIEAAKERPMRDRRDGEEVLAASGKDRIRLSIMRDIEYRVTWTRVPSTEMSMDPGMIRRTLRSYMDMFLRRGSDPVTYASTLAGSNDDSSSDEILSGAAFSHSVESDDEFDPRGSNPMHSALRQDQDEPAVNSGMGGLIKSVIERIATSGSQGASEAMALCLKLGIKFSFTSEDDGKGRLLPKSLVVTDTSKMHTSSAASATKDCAGNVLRIGLSFAQIRDSWPRGLWQPSIQSVGEYLRGNPRSRGAVQKFCDMSRTGPF